MKSGFKILIASCLLISFSSFAHDNKMKQEQTGKMHEEHMKCMNKTGKSMQECMQMMEESKGKANKEKAGQKKTSY